MMQPASVPSAQLLANGEHVDSTSHDQDAGDTFLDGEVPSQIHSSMNGGSMPPQQVFLPDIVGSNYQNGMAGLESQFQSLGLVVDDGDLDAEGLHDEDGVSVEDDGDENEDDPIKLFVGQVPKSMNEEDIFPTFDSFGPLKDVAIIRDKHTGLHRGCAFVTYWNALDADRAQEALHDKFTFPGGRRAAQVKPAEPSVPENKLFIGMLSRKAGEAEVRELFLPYGEIREIYMIRNADGSSKCAAFLRYMKRESAYKAIESLHNNIVMEGAARPLIVKFADNKHQRQARHIRNARKQEMIAAMTGPGYPGYPVPAGPHPIGIPPVPGGPQYPMHPQYPAFAPAAQPAPHPPQPHPYMFPAQYGPPPYGFPQRQDIRAPNSRPREGPAGANLFVYHLPHDLTDADLATAFNPFGNVISAKVYVDKFTGESKGFGFVSYDSVMSAEAAIEQMNGFQIGNKRLKVQHKRVHGHIGLQHQQAMASMPSPQAHPAVPPPNGIPGIPGNHELGS